MEDKEIQIDEVSINQDMEKAAENAEDATTPAPHATETGATTPQTADCGKQVDTLIDQIRDLNDKYLRLAAEMENTRRRAALDCESASRARAMGVAKNFLPVMDAVDAALKLAPNDEGIIAMQRAMNAAFAQIGIVRIEAAGQIMNPQFHNAVQAIEPSTQPRPAPNTIIEELQTGYMFGDTVMRTAMVVVAK